LDKLYHNLNLIELVRNWQDKDWKTFIWTLHIAVRRFMRSGDTSYATYLNHQVQHQLGLNEKNLPPELRRNNPPVVSPDSSPQGSDGAGTKRPAQSPPDGTPPDRRRNETLTTELGKHVQQTITNGRSKIGVDLRAGNLCPSNDVADRLLGPEYLALVSPSNQRPCLKAHLFNGCSRKGCKWAHTTSSKPSKPLLDSITTRLQARLDELATQYPK
jgi:hypothetical protein